MWTQTIVICFLWTIIGMSNLTNAQVKLQASLKTIINGTKIGAKFYCDAGQSSRYYTNHVLTWSKVSRDGRERYLSINWDRVQHGKNMGYYIRSQFRHGNIKNSPIKLLQEKIVFVLEKDELLPDDNGDYMCRMHDLDRNLIAEEAVPVKVYENGILLWPYRIEAKTGRDVNISCTHNTMTTNGGLVSISHMRSNGRSTVLVKDGKSGITSDKYVLTSDMTGASLEYVLTIKNIATVDEGQLVCELTSGDILIAKSQASISVDATQLKINPRFLLEVPQDAEAHFKCECDVRFENDCRDNDLRWSHSDQKTGNITDLYKHGKLLPAAVGEYEVFSEDKGSAKNLTIHGVKVGASDYICSLHGQTSGSVLAEAHVPVSVIAVSLRSMVVINNNNGIDTAILLCAVSGRALWDSHYFETHALLWKKKANGVETNVAINGKLDPGVDGKRYKSTLDLTYRYSHIAIEGVTKADHGEYICELMNTYSKKQLGHETLRMYGRGDPKPSTFVV